MKYTRSNPRIIEQETVVLDTEDVLLLTLDMTDKWPVITGTYGSDEQPGLSVNTGRHEVLVLFDNLPGKSQVFAASAGKWTIDVAIVKGA